MKLGQLKAAIRANKGSPLVVSKIASHGPELTLALQKTALLEELDRAYPGGKSVETGLTFDDATGTLRGAAGVADQPSVPETTVLSYYTTPGMEAKTIEVPTAEETASDYLLSDDPLFDLLTDMPAASTSLDDLLV